MGQTTAPNCPLPPPNSKTMCVRKVAVLTSKPTNHQRGIPSTWRDYVICIDLNFTELRSVLGWLLLFGGGLERCVKKKDSKSKIEENTCGCLVNLCVTHLRNLAGRHRPTTFWHTLKQSFPLLFRSSALSPSGTLATGGT